MDDSWRPRGAPRGADRRGGARRDRAKGHLTKGSPSTEDCEAFRWRRNRPVAGTLADLLATANKRYAEEGGTEP